MTLSEEALNRLADIVELQPTKNGELQERWGLDSGSEVHQYLESELGDYYYRDDNSLIRATDEAASMVDVEPGVDETDDGRPSTVRVPALQAAILDVLAAPDERAQSVVSVLHDLRDEKGLDPSSEDVRSGLQRLRQKNVVEVVYRNVPTFKLAVPRDELTVETTD